MNDICAARRVIADFSMGFEGPLLIAIAAMHGNEPAGVAAIEQMAQMLAHEIDLYENFRFRGRFVGIIGNVQAYGLGVRFVQQDLNRIWSDENVMLLDEEAQGKHAEDEFKEMRALHHTLQGYIDGSSSRKVVLIDLHTTSAEGGIFSIALDHNEDEQIALALKAPLVKGLVNGVSGTLLNYAKRLNGRGLDVHCVAFESGSHLDPLSVDRAVAGLVHAMRSIGCVEDSDVDHKHSTLLEEYSKQLPAVVEIKYVHHIPAGAEFCMRPGYVNFQRIAKGEHLADDRNGPILSPMSGFILMPLYQKQGNDGFFITIEPERAL